MKQILTFLLTSFLVMCCSSPNGKAIEVDLDSPVSLDEVLAAYEKNDTNVGIWSNPEVVAVLHSFAPRDTSTQISIDIYDEAPFFIELPEYRQSDNQFLSTAEDMYNSNLMLNAIWNNYEVWNRFSEEIGTDALEGTSRIKVDSLRDPELRQAATVYRDGVVEMLKNPESMNDDYNPLELSGSFIEAVNNKCYQFYTDVDSLQAIITEDWKSKSAAVEERYQTYLNADSDQRLGIMLKALAECKTFTEQCLLFEQWANCDVSESEDEWIIAVGTRLMDGQHYSTCLHYVWLIWRPLCQKMYYGMSKDSKIPNKMYDEYRAKCFKACLKQIAEHPDDVLAMNCASVLWGRGNIDRYGPYSFGNQCVIEEANYLPKRYEKIFNHQAEDDSAAE